MKLESSRFGEGVLDLIENLGKPVIAAINGFALGGGCETALACTFEAAYFGVCAATADKRGGTSAFLEKRVPQFHGS